MNSACTQTNLVIDGFLALLACGKCKQTPERPVRFAICGHFFCDSCVENDEVCRQCNTSVRFNEKRPYYMVAQLINYCTTIKEMISELDAGELWPLANAIHQFTSEYSERVEELHSSEVVEPAQSNEKDTDSDVGPETAGYVESTQNQRCQENNSQHENVSFAHSRQTNQKVENNDLRSENVSFVHSTQISQNREKNDLRPENVSFIHSRQISQNCEENDLQPENVNFVNSRQVSQKREKNDLHPEKVSFVNSRQSNQNCEENDLRPENVSCVYSSRISHRPEENDLRPENVSFVHSTQILQKRKERDAESETPGYIDPTQFSPILKEVNTDSETPGYRDPTQAIRQLNDSNLDFETPGYRDPTQIYPQRKDRFENETGEYIDPTSVNQHAKKTNKELDSVLLDAELASVTNWQDDMELEMEDNDLFSPIPESNSDDLLESETLEMEVTLCEGVIPETLEIENNPQNYEDTLTVSNAKDLATKKEKFVDRTLTKEIERMKTLQRKIFPMSNYDTVGKASESAGKAPPRLHRRLTDSALDRRNKISIKDFDTLSVPDVRDLFADDLDKNKTPLEEEPIKQRMKDSATDRRNWIPKNARDTPSVAAVRDSEMEKEAPPKQLRRIKYLKLDRQNKTPINAPNTLDVAEVGDLPKDTEDFFELNEFEQENAMTKLRSRIPMTDDETMNISNVQDTAMETVETVEKAQRKLLERTRDAMLPCRNETAINDDETLGIDKMRDSVMESVEMEKETPVKQLRRLSDWEVERQKRTSNNDDTMEIPFTYNDEKNKKVGPVKQLRRIRDLKLDRQNKSPMNARDRLDIGNTEDLTTETKEIPKGRSANQFERIKNLAMNRLNESSLSDRDTLVFDNGGGLAETIDFETEYINAENSPIERQDKIPMADCGTTSIVNVQDSAMEIGETLERAAPRQLRRLTDWPLNRHDEDSMNDSDTVDVANVGDLGNEFEKIPETRPLRQLKRLQNSKSGHHTIIPSDLHEIDITNMQDFGKEKQLNRPIDDSDTVNVTNVGNLFAKSEKIPEIRPLRQLRRLQNSKLGRSIISNDLRGVDITNIEDFTKEQAPFVENAPSKRGNLSMKRRSKSPPNDNHPLPVAIAGASATETEVQPPLKQLKSLENLETESQNKIPAKKAKAKIVQLKPRRRTIDKSATVPKAIPKNVNKRNAKGETLLHTACAKGQDDYVRTLLEAGANPNTKDNANWTPLQEVVKLGRRAICEMLLQFGASPNTPGIENRTPLHDASQNDKLEEAALLLRFNANRDVYDKYGKRPIDYAISDEMRALLTEDAENAVKKLADEVAYLNTTLDQSILMPNTKIVVLPSNLSSSNKKALMQIASKLKIAVATSFRSGVTHIVVEANERNNTELSYYVMLAILQGVWILNSQWIAISMDLNDISEIDLELFEVHGAPNPGTPERSRINEEKQNPRLFNNCFFYFAIGARGTWNYGKLEFTKASLTTLVLAGQGEILRREPNPENVKDNKITPFHVAHKIAHPLQRCSHYIIYMPGKDEPRIKYNMPHIKTLPLAWLLECIEKFALVDPILMGIS